MEKICVEKTTRLFIITIVIAVSYLIFYSILQAAFPQQTGMHMFQFSYQNTVQMTMSLVLALTSGLVASLFIKSKKDQRINVSEKSHALKIIKKKLSDDEKKLLKEVEKTGKITQDSLRARLGWSKAKASTIITRLDKMDLIQRERAGKTYYIFLSKDLK